MALGPCCTGCTWTLFPLPVARTRPATPRPAGCLWPLFVDRSGAHEALPVCSDGACVDGLYCDRKIKLREKRRSTLFKRDGQVVAHLVQTAPLFRSCARDSQIGRLHKVFTPLKPAFCLQQTAVKPCWSEGVAA